jgi:hypothetical protein
LKSARSKQSKIPSYAYPLDLDLWKDERISHNILNENNGIELRKELVKYFLIRHKNPKTPITLYGDCTITEEPEIKRLMDFYIELFKRNGLMK